MKPHKILIPIAEAGVPLALSELDCEFLAARPEKCELISDLKREIPDPVARKVLDAHEEAKRLHQEELGMDLVQHWLKSRNIGRYYPTDVLGMIGLSMIQHPDLLPAQQGLINEIEKHRRGRPPEKFAELVVPLSDYNFRRTLGAVRGNFSEGLANAGEYIRAIENVKRSLTELKGICEEYREVDRYLLLAFLASKTEKPELLEESMSYLASADSETVSTRLSIWAPKWQGIEEIIRNN